ncbi:MULTISPECIES: thioredoxin domain-containing protein [unclassified Nocardioides]|uniref:DsbA family protein n=1 Tax=unclassified Nocardioides TaxID=2615069 RepID=UPI0026665978|nr:thioredoxin domain-containing protein [Nocardioides sp. Arc9.136]WKN49728.1 thioredoxin domain-containing protein [Nocardioides sp. Arc9.136]
MSTKNRQQSRAERAAAAILEQERQERRRRALIVGGVVLLLLVVVAVGVLVQRGRDDTGEVAAPPAGATGQYSLAIGDADAPHQVVVYEDFLCPFCGALEGETRADLERLAADGQVYVEYRPFDLLSRYGDYSARATNAFAAVLDAAGPQVAKEFHDLLFENQPGESGPFPSDDDLVDLAVEAGAEEAQVRGAIEDREFDQWVQNATDAASRAGVNGTPTVLVDGEVFTDGDTVEELADNLVAAVE